MADLKSKLSFSLNEGSTIMDDRSDTNVHPSPQDFVTFIPWACRKLGVANIVEVTRIQTGTLCRISMPRSHI